jgi:hypothetical protein
MEFDQEQEVFLDVFCLSKCYCINCTEEIEEKLQTKCELNCLCVNCVEEKEEKNGE